MKFDADDMAVLDSLNVGEAVAYIDFLYVERAKHIVDAEETKQLWGYRFTLNDYTKAWQELWKSEERHHLKGIELIDLKIKEVQERFNLNEKV